MSNVLNIRSIRSIPRALDAAPQRDRTLFSQEAMNAASNYHENLRTFSKEGGKVNDKPILVWAKLKSYGNYFLHTIFGRKTIRQQNISDCLRVGLQDGYFARCINVNYTKARVQLQQIKAYGAEYFNSPKGSNDLTRLNLLLLLNGDKSIELTREALDKAQIPIEQFGRGMSNAKFPVKMIVINLQKIGCSLAEICMYMKIGGASNRHILTGVINAGFDKNAVFDELIMQGNCAEDLVEDLCKAKMSADQIQDCLNASRELDVREYEIAKQYLEYLKKAK